MENQKLTKAKSEAEAGKLRPSQDSELAEGGYDETVIQHEGKNYKKVQIEGPEGETEYLMDESNNLYNLNFEFVGELNVDGL